MVEILVVLLGCCFGGLPTIYVIGEAIHTIALKIYRKNKYGISLFD